VVGPAAARRLRLTVGGAEAGQRLDHWLAARLPGQTRSAMQRLIRAGKVRVDERTASKPGLVLDAGREVAVELPPEPAAALAPEEIPLTILYEDGDLLVIDKPADRVVHPGHGCREGTIVHALLGRGTPLASVGAPERPGIVHRLDRGTSGVLVVAKTDTAHLALARAFADREVDKRYTAVVWGHPRPASGTIDRPIGRSRTDRTRMSVASARGRGACTRYRTVQSLPGFALLDVAPRTGRTHQIRVHLQSIGHPIVGDERYGGCGWKGLADPRKRRAVREFGRLALHASRLALTHPASGEPMTFEAPLPAEFRSLIAALAVEAR
jgi:23S rRNA pseudouridine1911/1915/1917 synthase